MVNLVEGQMEVLGDGAGEFPLGLVTNGRCKIDGDVLLASERRGKSLAGSFGDGGMDTAAKTPVRGDDDKQPVGRRLVRGMLEDLCQNINMIEILNRQVGNAPTRRYLYMRVPLSYDCTR